MNDTDFRKMDHYKVYWFDKKGWRHINFFKSVFGRTYFIETNRKKIVKGECKKVVNGVEKPEYEFTFEKEHDYEA